MWSLDLGLCRAVKVAACRRGVIKYVSIKQHKTQLNHSETRTLCCLKVHLKLCHCCLGVGFSITHCILRRRLEER